MVDLVLGLNGFRVNVKGEVRVSYPFLGIGVAFREVSAENDRELQAMVRSLVTAEAPANSASGVQVAKGHPSIVAIASPDGALQTVVDFFQAHSLLSREEFLQLLRKARCRVAEAAFCALLRVPMAGSSQGLLFSVDGGDITVVPGAPR